MDFIERWFHLSPDNGNGTTELLFLLVAVALVLAIVFRRRLVNFLTRRGKDL
jgi:hypothetical protein